MSTEPRTHDEFCFNTDLYQDDVEDYMCICNRLDDARRQERTDQQELTKAAVAEAEQRWADDPGPLAAHYAKGAADERERGYLDGHKDGHAAGVQAARDAVAARAERFVNPETGEFYIVKSAALAAIDALKGES